LVYRDGKRIKRFWLTTCGKSSGYRRDCFRNGYDDPQRAANINQEVQGEAKHVSFTRKKNNGTRTRKDVKPEMIMHASSGGRERKRGRYRTSDTEGQTSKNVKLCMYFVHRWRLNRENDRGVGVVMNVREWCWRWGPSPRSVTDPTRPSDHALTVEVPSELRRRIRPSKCIGVGRWWHHPCPRQPVRIRERCREGWRPLLHLHERGMGRLLWRWRWKLDREWSRRNGSPKRRYRSRG